MLVLERTWGSVSRALKNGPFGSRQAMRIADQVNSAVHYLRKLRMSHGAVGIDNVALVSSPRHTNVLAKLTNFANATERDSDQGALNEDIYACAVFISNLFVDHYSKCVAFDDKIPKEQLFSLVSHNILLMRVRFHALADMLNYIVSPDGIGESEVDNIFYDLHQVFQNYILSKSEEGPIQQASHDGEERRLQPVLERTIAFRPALRPPDSEDAPYSSMPSANANFTDPSFPASLNLDNFEFPERRFEERERVGDALPLQEWLQKGEETRQPLEEPDIINL